MDRLFARKRLLHRWGTALRFTAIAAALGVSMAAGGCASGKTDQAAAPAPAATGAPGSLHGTGGRFLVDPDAQIRWSYDSLPDPAPSVRPNYLLKSYLCEAGSGGLNSEARGTLVDLVETLKTKPEVRVLCLGLCDAAGERVNAQNLGMTRAQNARKFLIDQGIAKTRIEAATFGSSVAQAPPEEKIGQRLDRKVEVWLLSE